MRFRGKYRLTRLLLYFKTCFTHYKWSGGFVGLWLVNLLLRFLGWRKYRIFSMTDYVDKLRHRGDKLIRTTPERLIFCVQPRFDDKEEEKVIECRASSLYIAELHDVEAIIGSNFVLTDRGEVVCDMLAGDVHDRIQFHNAWSDGNRMILLRPFEEISSDGPLYVDRGILWTGNYAFNYYHLTVEIMPRLQKVDHYVPQEVPLIVDSQMVRFPQFRELIALFNRSSRPIIEIGCEQRCRFGTLYYPALSSYIIPNIKCGKRSVLTDTLFDRSALEYVRQMVLAAKSDRQFAKRIFLYRNSALRLFNQDEVFAALQPLGFEKIAVETLSLIDQAALFYQAEIIVGGSGATFTNLLYCSPDSKAYILTNYRYDQIAVFSSLASVAGMSLFYVPAHDCIFDKGSETEAIHDDFDIDPQKVVEFVTRTVPIH